MSPQKRAKKPRRQLQRAFVQWLAANRHRLRIPVSISRRTDSGIDLRLHGINPAIEARLTESKSRGRTRNSPGKDLPAGSYQYAYSEIVVAMVFEGRSWDQIYFELIEVRRPDGYCCGLCMPDDRKRYATRTDLLNSELFEPLATWINEELFPANFLLLREMDGSTWAKFLIQRPSDKPINTPSNVTHYLPIRHERASIN